SRRTWASCPTSAPSGATRSTSRCGTRYGSSSNSTLTTRRSSGSARSSPARNSQGEEEAPTHEGPAPRFEEPALGTGGGRTRDPRSQTPTLVPLRDPGGPRDGMNPGPLGEPGPMPRASSPRIEAIRVRAGRVPMREPHQTASGVVSESPLVLTDITLDDGTIGHSVIFTYTAAVLEPTAALVRNFESLGKGEVLAPAETEQKFARRFRLLGSHGLVGMALSAIDMALWDALARLHGVSLTRILGGTEKA